ncbi:MAG: hypothetical protein R3F14_43005, partial [Polyangiaceae bacterium]
MLDPQTAPGAEERTSGVEGNAPEPRPSLVAGSDSARRARAMAALVAVVWGVVALRYIHLSQPIF